MLGRIIGTSLFIAQLLCACSERPDEGAQGLVERWAPSYGAVRPVQAYWSAGIETSEITFCERRGEQCHTYGGSCWAEFTDQAYREVRDIIGRDRAAEGGEFWLEGEGRMAKPPGPFGHTDAYPCQMELTAVHVIEEIDMFEELGMPGLNSLDP